MPFFLVYDPPASNGPYLIGTVKGGRCKQFETHGAALKRLRQVGRSARNLTTMRQFDNLADATSHCVHIKQQRRLATPVTYKTKRAPEGALDVPGEPG